MGIEGPETTFLALTNGSTDDDAARCFASATIDRCIAMGTIARFARSRKGRVARMSACSLGDRVVVAADANEPKRRPIVPQRTTRLTINLCVNVHLLYRTPIY